jgi:hypothetical protein
MAPRTNHPQGFVKQAILATHIRRVAIELYRADRLDLTAQLSDLPPNEQKIYERIATFVVFLSDESLLRPAVYAAADSMVDGGIERLGLEQRKLACAAVLNAFKVMKAAINGELHSDTADLMRRLVDEDKACGINAQPVNSKPVMDLASVETPAEVH